ncbi:MAG: hypothetical protein QOF66_7299 [Mycobacterium sp.]|jgi:cytochrome P450|uniref:cytochrome P450 n=1 Tax=Mycobacterium sp. TaxID=1785 RepID=UPI0028B6DD29|nr:hypothetical protein [Mycobacterium sp.]
MQSAQTFDIEGVDFAFDDQPDLHAVLARLRTRKPYAVVPFAGTPAVLLLTDELVRAAFRDEVTFPAAPVYAVTTEPVFGRTVLSMSGNEHRANRMMVSAPLRRNRVQESASEFTEYVAPLLAERRREPRDDMISMLIAATTEDAQSLDDEQICRFLRMLFPLGADTTMLALGNILSALLNHREQLDLLRSDLERHVQQAVWEGMRWEPAVGMLPRACPEAVTWHGIEIPASTPMIFAINAAHRDPAVYERPDEFDITRNVMPAVSFGQGPHSCIGNWLANTELVAALRLLMRRLPDLTLNPEQAHTSTITSQVGTTLRGPNALHVTFTPG